MDGLRRLLHGERDARAPRGTVLGCKLLVSIKNVLFGRLASSPPAEYNSALRRSQASLLKVERSRGKGTVLR